MHSNCAAVACSHVAYSKIAGWHFDDLDKHVVIVNREFWHLDYPLVCFTTASRPVGIAAAGRDAMWKGYLGYLFLFNVFVAVFIFANGESYIGFHN